MDLSTNQESDELGADFWRRAVRVYRSVLGPRWIRWTIVAAIALFPEAALITWLRPFIRRGGMPEMLALVATFAGLLSLTEVVTIGLSLDVTRAAGLPIDRDRKSRTIRTGLALALVVWAGLALFVLPGLWVWSRCHLAAPAAAVHRLGPRAALRRSYELTEDVGFWAFLAGAFLLLPRVGPIALLARSGPRPIVVFALSWAWFTFLAVSRAAQAWAWFDVLSRERGEDLSTVRMLREFE